MAGGLLDFLETPEGQGLLAATFGGLAGAQRGTPVNNIGRAGLAGLSGYSGAQDRISSAKQLATEQAMKTMQMEKMRREAANETGLTSLQGQYFNPGQPGSQVMDGQQGPDMPAQPAKFDVNGFASAAAGKGFMSPMQAIQLQSAMAKDTGVDKIDPTKFTPASLAKFSTSRNFGDLQPRDKLEFVEGVGINPFDQSNANRAIPNANKPFSMSADGKVVANPQFQAYEISKAGAGAARTSVNVTNKMGEGLASQVGPMMRDSASASEAAGKQIDAANKITNALDQNKMFAGTGANIQLGAAQLASSLGVGGKDNEERIANTRVTLQNLAQLTLQGRQQMKGQGAITESESKLAERAVSGDITLTPGEIRILANAAKRSGGYAQSEHSRKLSVIQKTPSLAEIAPFYDVQNIQPEAVAPPKADYKFVNGKLVKVQ